MLCSKRHGNFFGRGCGGETHERHSVHAKTFAARLRRSAESYGLDWWLMQGERFFKPPLLCVGDVAGRAAALVRLWRLKAARSTGIESIVVSSLWNRLHLLGSALRLRSNCQMAGGGILPGVGRLKVVGWLCRREDGIVCL